jgi:hypothetical protein
MHCWIVGRNARGLWDVLTGIRRYDGHPFLWYYLLHLVSRVSRAPAALHATTIVIATLSSYLWLRHAPLPRLLRIPLLGGYLFFYEYSVLSRSYALGLLFLFLFCRFYRRSVRRIPFLAFLLVALLLTSAYGALLAVALALVLFGYGLVDVFEAPAKGESRLKTAAYVVAGMVLFNLGAQLFWFTSPPPDDGFFAIPGMLGTSPPWSKLASFYWSANLPRYNPGNGLWPVTAAVGDSFDGLASCLPWLGLGLFAAWLVALRKVALVAIAYACGVLAIALFQHYVYAGALRHYGHYFVLTLACLWLHEKQRSPLIRDAAGTSPKLLRALWAVTLLPQIITGAQAVKAEIQLPFSGSVQAATYLRSHGLEDAPLVGSFDHAVSAVTGYLDRPFRSAESGEMATSVVFHNRRWRGAPLPLIFEIALLEARKSGRPAILILNRDLGDYRRGDADIQPLYVTDAPIVADERFAIVRVVPVPTAP